MRQIYRFLFLAVFCVSIQSPVNAQVRINEIGSGVDFMGSTKWIELYNAGSTAVETDTMQFCNWPAYSYISDSAVGVLAGTTEIPAGGYLVVSWSNIDPVSGELGLYNSVANGFGDDANIRDYLEYGAAGFVRESVAALAGIWSTGDFVAIPEAGNTLSYFEFGATTLEKWRQGQPTPGAANESPVGIEDLDVPTRSPIAAAYPNPFIDRTSVEFSLDTRAEATLKVLDTLGRVVFTSQPHYFDAGATHVVNVDLSGFPSGIYVYQLTLQGPDYVSSTSGTMTRIN